MSMFTRIDTDAIVAEVEEAIQYFDVKVSKVNLNKILERVGDSIQEGMAELTQEAEEKDGCEESCDEMESEKEGLESQLADIEHDLEWDKMQASFDLYAHGVKI